MSEWSRVSAGQARQSIRDLRENQQRDQPREPVRRERFRQTAVREMDRRAGESATGAIRPEHHAHGATVWQRSIFKTAKRDTAIGHHDQHIRHRDHENRQAEKNGVMLPVACRRAAFR